MTASECRGNFISRCQKLCYLRKLNLLLFPRIAEAIIVVRVRLNIWRKEGRDLKISEDSPH